MVMNSRHEAWSWVSWNGPKPAWWWLVVGVAPPALVVLLFVAVYGVNVQAFDEWNEMTLIQTFMSGGDWMPQVFDFYHEHRIVLPKLILVLNTTLTHYNVKVEMFLSAGCLILTTWMCWLLVRRDQENPAWLIVPIAWLVLSIGQRENLLVGWQFQIPLTNALVVATVLFLDRDELLLGRWLAAFACAAAATFSFANGMSVWPAALVVLLARPAHRRRVLIWIATAAVAVTLYVWGYNSFDQTPAGYYWTTLRNPGAAARLFLAIAGSSFGGESQRGNVVAGLAVIVTLGGALLVMPKLPFDGATRLSRLAHRCLPIDSSGRLLLAPWFALLAYSVMSAVAIAVGRAFNWREFAVSTRYVTLGVFIPVATVVLLTRAGAVLARRKDGARRVVRVVAIILSVVAVLGVGRAAKLSVTRARLDRINKLRARDAVLHHEVAATRDLQRLFHGSGQLVRQGSRILERWRLGPFADGDPYPPKVDGEVGQPWSLTGPAEEQTVVVWGWAVVNGKEPPAAVVLALDGEWVAVTTGFVAWGPIAPPVALRAVDSCRWRVNLDVDKLVPGEHTIRGLAVERGGSEPVDFGRERRIFITTDPQAVAPAGCDDVIVLAR